MKALFYKVATNGLFMSKTFPTNHPGQPHIVAIAATLVEAAPDGPIKTIDSFSGFSHPDGWTIPPQASDVHGITQDIAMRDGMPEQEVLTRFLNLWGGVLNKDAAVKVVGFGEAFDMRVIRTALMRFTTDSLADDWKEADHCDIRGWCAGYAETAGKMLKLTEAHEQMVGNKLADPGHIISAVDAYIAIYQALRAKPGFDDPLFKTGN